MHYVIECICVCARVCVCVPRLYSEINGSPESNQVDFGLIKDGDFLI